MRSTRYDAILHLRPSRTRQPIVALTLNRQLRAADGLVGRGHTCTITSVQKDNLVLEIYKYDIMTARNILHILKGEPKEGGVAVLD